MKRKLSSVCPICGRAYSEPPALSRKDSTTEICPECGMMEALAAIPRRREEPAERTRRAVQATGNEKVIAPRIGDMVKMVNCLEAEHYADRIWQVVSEPWKVCGSTVVKLKGFPGGFDVTKLERMEV